MANLVTAILGHRIRCELIDTGVGTKIWSVRFFERGRPNSYTTWAFGPGTAAPLLTDALAGATKLARTWQWK